MSDVVDKIVLEAARIRVEAKKKAAPAPTGPQTRFDRIVDDAPPKKEVLCVIEVVGVGLSVPELICRLPNGDSVILNVPPESLVKMRAALERK